MKRSRANQIVLLLWAKHWQTVFAFTARRSPPWALQMLRHRGVDTESDSYLIVCSTPSTSTVHEETEQEENHKKEISHRDEQILLNHSSSDKVQSFPMSAKYRYFENKASSNGNQMGKLLFSMTRPANFPIVILFHIIGVQSVVARVVPNASSSTLIYSLLTHPSLIATLITILLISAVSMVVNDYYDARLGVDSILVSGRLHNTPTNNKSSPSMHRKPLATGDVSFDKVKQFLYYLYSFLLISSSLIPGIPTRLSVATATILTFVYTKYLKPHTWVKNISCAILMALSPFTSGCATLYTLGSDRKYHHLLHGLSLTAFPSISTILLTSIGPLVLTLFCGFMTREILMDISDYESDKASRIMTIPVKYGRRVAIRVALAFLSAMSISACAYPFWELLQIDFTTALSSMISRNDTTDVRFFPFLSFVMKTPGIWKTCFSILGSSWMMIRLQQVLRSEGEDRRILDRFIEEGKGAILFILASFLIK